jgi:hypothetical protein
MNITCSECMFVDVGILHEMRMRNFPFCGLSVCTIFFYISHKRTALEQKVLKIVCVFFLFSPQLLSETFLI